MISENYKIVPIYNNYNLATHDTTQPSDSWNMKDFHRATIILQYNTLGNASPIVYVYSGTTDGAQTSALTFHYAFSGADTGTAAAGSATSCDVLAAWGSSAALTVTHGTYTDRMLIIEIDASAMDVANGEEWMTVNHTDPTTGATGTVIGFAILTPRYSSNRSGTCLA